MWKLCICKIGFAICADSLCYDYLRRIQFDLAYGKKGKKKYIAYHLNNSLLSKILLRNAFGNINSTSRRFCFYNMIYRSILILALPSYVALLLAALHSNSYFSWFDLVILIPKSILWLLLRLHFDNSNVSIFVRR